MNFIHQLLWYMQYMYNHIGNFPYAEFSCLICKQVMTHPVTTPCAHNFCKSCLDGAFSGQSFVRERSRGGRTLRSQKNVMKCPFCTNDISDFLKDPQVRDIYIYSFSSQVEDILLQFSVDCDNMKRLFKLFNSETIWVSKHLETLCLSFRFLQLLGNLEKC